MYKAQYHRFGSAYSKDFDTAQEAAQFLLDGEYDGSLSWDSVVDENYNVLADGNTRGYEALYSIGAK